MFLANFSRRGSLKAFLFLSSCIFFVTSCKQDGSDGFIPGTATGDKVSVVDGRLYFPSQEIYLSTINSLVDMTDQERQKWVAKYNFVSMGSILGKEKLRGPFFYKFLLNKNHEARIQDKILKIIGETVYNVPLSDKPALESLKKSDFKAESMEAYASDFIRSGSLANEKRVRYGWGRPRIADNLVHEFDALGGDNRIYRQRFVYEMVEYTDGNSGTNLLQLYLQYLDGSNWRDAIEDCFFTMQATSYTQKIEQTSYSMGAFGVVNSYGGCWEGITFGYSYPAQYRRSFYGLNTNFTIRCPVLNNKQWSGTKDFSGNWDHH